MRRRLAVTLIFAVACAAGLGCWKLGGLALAGPPALPPPAVPVIAARAESRDVPAILPALGTVLSQDTVNVTPRVDGRIVAVYFHQGDRVAKGQKLFLIDPRPYRDALAQAQGQLAHDRAVLAEAKMDFTRYQRLRAENSIATQTEQDQVYIVGQDEGTVALDKANIAAAELNLGYCHIDAPIAGRTGALQVDLGNYVQAAGDPASSSSVQPTASGSPVTSGASPAVGASPLVTITRMHPILVSFSVPENTLDAIRQHQAKAPLTVAVYSPAGKLLARGRLTLIDNQIAATTGTIMLEGTFANRHERLWPGEFVAVRLVEFVRHNAVTIPADAVMTGPDGSYVYIIGAGSKVSRVNVQVTATQNKIAVIGEGLKAGEEVVTNGQYRLDNGVVVSIAAPKLARAG
ncbi:MAG: efflux RND transporter periplasmic adaptor subunit [Stellaceae bacterium]